MANHGGPSSGSSGRGLRAVVRIVLVGVVGLGLFFGLRYGQKLFRASEERERQQKSTSAARLTVEKARQALQLGHLGEAARGYLAAYESGLREPAVQVVLPWLVNRLDVDVVSFDHGSDVAELAFSPDGKLLLAAGVDHTAHLYDVEKRERARRLSGHRGSITHAAFSRDGSRVLTLSKDGSCRLFQAATGSALAVFESPDKSPLVYCLLALAGTRVVAVDEDGRARLYQDDGKLVASLSVSEGPAKKPGRVSQIVAAPDGSRIAAVSGSTAALFDGQSGQPIATLSGHAETIKDATFSPDSRRLVTSSADQTARLWDVATGALITTLEGHTGTVYTAGFMLAGWKAVMTVSADGTARLWDAATGRSLFPPVGHPRHSQTLAISPDGGRIVVRTESDAIELWDRFLGHMRAQLTAHTGEVTVVSFAPSGRRIATGGADGTARLFDARTGQLMLTVRGHRARVGAIAVSPDSGLLASASADGMLRISRTHQDRYPVALPGHSGEITALAWSPDGAYLLSASRDGSARLFSVKTGEHLRTFEGPRRAISEARLLAKDGGLVALTAVRGGATLSSGRTPGSVRLFEVKQPGTSSSDSEQPVRVLGDDLDFGEVLALSPLGSHVVTGLPDGSLLLHRIADGQQPAVLRGPSPTPVPTAVFSPDGKLIAAPDGRAKDELIRVFDGQSGRELLVLQGHEQTVRTLAFCPDASCLVSGGADQTARVFELGAGATRGAARHVLPGQVGEVRGVFVSPDGSRILTVDIGDRAWLWKADSGQLSSAVPKTGKGASTYAFSPDGGRLLVASDELRLFDSVRGHAVVALDDKAEVFTQAAFSPDGTLLATGTQTGGLKLWDVHLETRPVAEVAADLKRALGGLPTAAPGR